MTSQVIKRSKLVRHMVSSILATLEFLSNLFPIKLCVTSGMKKMFQ